MIIDSLVAGHYRIPLPVAPERSGHGVQLDWRALGSLQVR